MMLSMQFTGMHGYTHDDYDAAMAGVEELRRRAADAEALAEALDYLYRWTSLGDGVGLTAYDKAREALTHYRGEK